MGAYYEGHLEVVHEEARVPGHMEGTAGEDLLVAFYVAMLVMVIDQSI